MARFLAFAHPLDAQIRGGAYDDLADAARKLGLKRARVTAGHDPISERTLRPIVAEPVWERQIARWRFICSRGGS